MTDKQLLKNMVFTSLFTALTFIFTFSIKIPVPITAGYIHPGDSMVFLSALILPYPFAIFAAGVGSMLADLIGGYGNWALPTLIIKSLMAVVVCASIRYKSNKKFQLGLGVIGSVSWLSFIGFIYQKLATLTGAEQTLLIGELEDVSTVEGLTSHLSNLQLSLGIFTIAVPIILLILYLALKKYHTLNLNFIGLVVAGLVMIIGYYLTSAQFYGYLPAILSVVPNIVQFIVGFLIATLVGPTLLKIGKSYGFLGHTS